MLADCGHVAEHVNDLGMRESADSAIWEYAIAEEAVIATKDEDFASRALIDIHAPIIVWLRIGNSSRRALLQWFRPMLPEIESRIKKGETLLEVR